MIFTGCKEFDEGQLDFLENGFNLEIPYPIIVTPGTCYGYHYANCSFALFCSGRCYQSMQDTYYQEY